MTPKVHLRPSLCRKHNTFFVYFEPRKRVCWLQMSSSLPQLTAFHQSLSWEERREGEEKEKKEGTEGMGEINIWLRRWLVCYRAGADAVTMRISTLSCVMLLLLQLMTNCAASLQR